MPDVSFVCCVESGGLESQTVRLVQSLRRYGGRYADAPLIAVTPRFGPALRQETRELFRTHDVTYLCLPSPPKYAWFNYYNKPWALVAAEAHIDTPMIGFLDSDLLIVDEPDRLDLGPDEDLVAFPVEVKEMGTTGPGDPYEEFWKACCQVAGFALETLPWITTAQTAHRIRLYFNSGILVYRRSTGFAQEYLRLCRALLDARIGTHAPGFGLGFMEQVAVVYAATTLGLKWRALPYSHNYPMSRITHADWYSLEALKDAKIVHYHDAMWPVFWPTFLACMRDAHPAVAPWLATLGPMQNDASFTHRVLSRLLYFSRRRHATTFLAASTIY